MDNGSTCLTPHSGASRRCGMEVLTLVLLVAFAVGFAAHLFALNWSDTRWRWNALSHDRNGHYAYGLNMGLALREGNLPRFFTQLERGKVWPPVHGLLVAAVVAVAGPDHRLAVLPSLSGWFLTVVFGFLAARRLLPSLGAGNLAGALTVTFIAASPAHRMYATDVMLESLGAGLSMLTLYLYLRTVQTPVERRRCSALAIALTVLFFEKYNYWGLVVLALAGDQLICEWRRNLGWLQGMRDWPWRSWLARQWREPLNYLFVALAVAVTVVQLRGPTAFELLGRRVSIYPPHNLATMAYAVLLWRVIQEMVRRRPAVMAWLGIPGRHLLLGHLLPVSVSFLLPGRLSNFLWFIGPLNLGGQTPRPLGEAAGFYIQPLIHDYHPMAWCLVLVGILALTAVIMRRQLRPGWSAVALLAGFSMVLVIMHPHQQPRFLHSWFPAAWVLAGAGGGALLYTLPLGGLGRARHWLAAALVIAVIVTIGPAWRGPGYAAGSGNPSSPSTLDIADCYLPHLGEARLTAFFIGAGEQFVNWTYREHYRRSQGLEETGWWMRLTPVGEVLRQLPVWLAAKRPDAVVVINFSPRSQHYYPAAEQQVAGVIAAIMPLQTDYSLVHRCDLVSHQCAVTVWRRR